jgi:hypothetical protein
MKHVGWVLGLVAGLASVGCGDDGADEQAKGGSCVQGSSCFMVTNPANYDVKTECGFTGGVWSASTCDMALYERKCTEVVEVEENGKTSNVTYVRYFPAGTNVACSGTLEDF